MQWKQLSTQPQATTCVTSTQPRQPWHKPQLVELPIQETASGDIPGIEGTGVFDDDFVMFTSSS